MKNEIQYLDGVKFRRVSKADARDLFYKGVWIYCVPNKLTLQNDIMYPLIVREEKDKHFDARVNSFREYSCNSYDGKTLAFYVKEEEL